MFIVLLFQNTKMAVPTYSLKLHIFKTLGAMEVPLCHFGAILFTQYLYLGLLCKFPYY